MRKLFFNIAAAVALFAACDVVDNPYPQPDFVGDCDPTFDDTIYNDTNYSGRKIMLEDFTGQKCPNCPEAADISQSIFEANPNDVIPIALHNSGPFSEPDPEDGYPLDMQTETGQKLLQEYQIGFYPAGLLNRSEINGSYIQAYQTWENTISNLLADNDYISPRFKIKMQVIYNSDCRVIRIYPTVDVLQDITGSLYMVGYILEDGIIGKQIDNREPSGYVENYEHKHVLRIGFPFDGDGQLIFTDPVVGDNYTAETEEESIAANLEDDWVADNLSVVFFIRDLDSGEILGADMVHLAH